MNWEWIIAFGAGCAVTLAASTWYRQALAGAARRQREADQKDMDQMQHSLRRMAARCATNDAEIGKRRMQAAWQAGVIQGNAMANRREMCIRSRWMWE